MGHQSWLVRGRPVFGRRGVDGRVLALAAVASDTRRASRSCWFLPWGDQVAGAAEQAGHSAPVDDLGLVDHEAVVVGGGAGRGRRRRRSRRRRSRRRSGTRRGGGCRRPAPRSARPSPTAGCGAPARRRSARAARRRRPGGRPRAGRSGRRRIIVSVSACGVRVHGAQHGHPRPGHPQGGTAQQVLEVVGRGHVRQSCALSGTSQDWRPSASPRGGGSASGSGSRP